MIYQRVQTALDDAGVTWRGAAGGEILLPSNQPVWPPGTSNYYAPYFDFYLQNHQSELDNYVTACANFLSSSYNGLEKLAVVALLDEPGWNYGINMINKGQDWSCPAPQSVTANNLSTSTQINTAVNITFQATDTNLGAVLTYGIVAQPTHGQLTGSGQTMTYTPSTGFTGIDNFTYQVTDSVGGTSNMATVTITITTSPTPIRSAQQQISSWVKQGGVLAVTPGGGVADEYNWETSIFDTILGLDYLNFPRTANRIAEYDIVNPTAFSSSPHQLFNKIDTIRITDSRFGSASMDISFPKDELHIPTTNATATPVATFSDGISPAITINRYGSGYGIAYAFFPGFHYEQSANWDTGPWTAAGDPSQGTALPYGWGKPQRDIITAPAKIANTPRPVTLTQNGKILEIVEACLLESDKGYAIVLLNWSDTPAHVPIKNMTITLNDPTINIPVSSLISSAQGNVVTPEV